MHKHKTMKFDVVVERPVTDNVYPNHLNRLKRVEKLHPLKSQPMFSEAPRREWREPFDFPPDFRISLVNAKYRSFDKLFTLSSGKIEIFVLRHLVVCDWLRNELNARNTKFE